MTDYIILDRENTTELEIVVREFIRRDYTPIGSPFYDGKKFYQAMTRKSRGLRND